MPSLAIRVTVYVSSALMTFLLVQHLLSRGGPYFEIPETVQDHVLRGMPLSRQAIVMSRRAEPLLPRGVTVTVIAPALAPNYDATHYLTASGLLPHQHVLHPTFEGGRGPEFVIALGSALENPAYHLVREFPEGRIYRRGQ
ncbi:MAG: hypothetical protein AABO58_11265 [Acidobacteriota bacterium]